MHTHNLIAAGFLESKTKIHSTPQDVLMSGPLQILPSAGNGAGFTRCLPGFLTSFKGSAENHLQTKGDFGISFFIFFFGISSFLTKAAFSQICLYLKPKLMSFTICILFYRRFSFMSNLFLSRFSTTVKALRMEGSFTWKWERDMNISCFSSATTRTWLVHSLCSFNICRKKESRNRD